MASRKHTIKMTFIERIMVQHANPQKLLIDICGILLGMYFLWENNLLLALVCLFGLSVLGTMVAWGKNESHLAKTSLGKFMLGQTHPVNLILRSIGASILAYGFWTHSFLIIICGIIVILIARKWKKQFTH